MFNESNESFILWKAGSKRDGYFTNDDLVRQLEASMPFFQDLHKDKTLVFAFDNSTGHHKRHPNGLDAELLPLKDGGANAPIMRNTKFILRDGTECIQVMQNSNGEQKGLKTILIERGLWKNHMLLQCKPCKDKIPHSNRYPNARPYNNTMFCCAKTCLANQPDFLAQREWLREVVEDAGHKIIFFPKFHPELNHIEMVWCYMKQAWRRKCDNSFRTLERELPNILKDIPVAFIRRTQRHCLKRMEGYRMGLSGPFLDFIMKKQKSHRCIDPEAIQLAQEQFLVKYPHLKKTITISPIITVAATPASAAVMEVILTEEEELASNGDYAEI